MGQMQILYFSDSLIGPFTLIWMADSGVRKLLDNWIANAALTGIRKFLKKRGEIANRAKSTFCIWGEAI